MAGKSPHEAVRNFVGPLGKALSCVTKSVVSVGGGYAVSPKPHVATLNKAMPVDLPPSNLQLYVSILYSITEADMSLGPWKVKTEGYIYELTGPSEFRVGYHWHQRGRSPFTGPHAHVGSIPGHLPTGRVALEEILRLAIAELGVTPLRPDWQEVLAATQGAFEEYRTWP